MAHAEHNAERNVSVGLGEEPDFVHDGAYAEHVRIEQQMRGSI